jgi:peptidoglycan/xylan/chitin deacetylase (PgdA/CDA1 family)
MEKGLVSLTFDDGLRCQFENALPILDQHGFPATFFLVANTAPIHVDWSDHPEWRKITWNENDIEVCKEMVRKGHEIGSHSVWHLRVNSPNLNPQFESAESRRLIQDWIGTPVTSFCYPFYRTHQVLVEALKSAGYEQARGGGKPPLYGASASHYPIPDNGSLDRFNVDCRQISQNEDVGGWIRPRCWHVLTFHGIGGQQDGWDPISVPEFARQMAELAKYKDSGEVEIVTFKDGAARCGK